MIDGGRRSCGASAACAAAAARGAAAAACGAGDKAMCNGGGAHAGADDVTGSRASADGVGAGAHRGAHRIGARKMRLALYDFRRELRTEPGKTQYGQPEQEHVEHAAIFEAEGRWQSLDEINRDACDQGKHEEPDGRADDPAQRPLRHPRRAVEDPPRQGDEGRERAELERDQRDKNL